MQVLETSRPKLDLQDSSLLKSLGYCGGRWIAAADEASFAITDPADGELVGRVARLGARESGEAVAHAEAAFPAWSAAPSQERAALPRRWFQEVSAHREDLARIMTVEQGKPLTEARGEIDCAASLPEVLRRRGQATQHRGRDLASAECRGRTLARAAGHRGAGHALELSLHHDHAQGRRLHGRGPSLCRGPLLGAGPGRAGSSGRSAGRGLQRHSRERSRGRCALARGYAGPRALLRRLHGGRQGALSALGRHGEAPGAGTGRPCSLSGLCRLRPRSRGRGGGQGQVRDQRPELPRSQPLPDRAQPRSGFLRPLRQGLCGARHRSWLRRPRPGSLDQRARRLEAGSGGRRCHRPRCGLLDRRRAHRLGPPASSRRCWPMSTRAPISSGKRSSDRSRLWRPSTARPKPWPWPTPTNTA